MDLDGPGSHQHAHAKTDFFIKNFDPEILWDDFGIWHDIVVCLILSAWSSLVNTVSSAFYTCISMGRHS